MKIGTENKVKTGVAAALLIVAVVLVWLLVIDAGGSNTPAPTTPVTTPVNTTPA